MSIEDAYSSDFTGVLAFKIQKNTSKLGILVVFYSPHGSIRFRLIIFRIIASLWLAVLASHLHRHAIGHPPYRWLAVIASHLRLIWRDLHAHNQRPLSPSSPTRAGFWGLSSY